MPDCRFANFDIAVHGQAAPYLVHALYAGHSAEGELAIDHHTGDWEARLARLGAAARAWAGLLGGDGSTPVCRTLA